MKVTERQVARITVVAMIVTLASFTAVMILSFAPWFIDMQVPSYIIWMFATTLIGGIFVMMLGAGFLSVGSSK